MWERERELQECDWIPPCVKAFEKYTLNFKMKLCNNRRYLQTRTIYQQTRYTLRHDQHVSAMRSIHWSDTIDWIGCLVFYQFHMNRHRIHHCKSISSPSTKKNKNWPIFVNVSVHCSHLYYLLVHYPFKRLTPWWDFKTLWFKFLLLQKDRI